MPVLRLVVTDVVCMRQILTDHAVRIEERRIERNVEQRMADLAGIKAALERLAQACRGKGPTSGCPILDAIEQEDGHGDR